MKYYFMSYSIRKNSATIFGCLCTNIHPFKMVTKLEHTLQATVSVINFKEITKEEFELWRLEA